MEITIERIKLILMLNKCGIASKFANKYNAELLMNRTADLEINDVPKPNEKQYHVQEELIRNSAFADYFKQLHAKEIHFDAIENLLKELSESPEENEQITSYEFESVLKTLKQSDLVNKYDYLKFFSTTALNQEINDLLISNLNWFYKQDITSFSELSEVERQLFLEPYISNSELIPLKSIKRACELILEDENIKSLIQLLFENEVVDVVLNIEDYERIKENSYQIKQSIIDINKAVSNNACVFSDFIYQWVTNGCNAYDLKILKEKIPEIPQDELDSAFASRLSYINLVFGNKIKNIPFSNEPEYRKDLLIYAITHKKNRFIQLVEDNYGIFSSLSIDSILFNKDFYSKYVNINSLNIQNLKDCANMHIRMSKRSRQWDVDILAGESYTFEEVKALYGFGTQYINLYKQLTLKKIDVKLITFRQIAKRELLIDILDDENISSIADKLSQKPLSGWLETDFSHIKDLQYIDVIQILISYEKIKNFIPQIKNRIEALFILQNQNSIQEYSSIDEIKNQCMQFDKSWSLLQNKLSISDEFINEHKKRIIDFILQSGSNIALTYYNNLSKTDKKESFKKIVKAELMGKFSTLKYFEDDLIREIEHHISSEQKNNWVKNLEKVDNGIIVEERDDFYKTMQLGTIPQQTCLSYINGAYKECLLSCFDSNKKFLYASINGKIVGRAIIRLTKGNYNNPTGKENTSLSFVDIENIPEGETSKDADSSNEILTLFLEKPYIAHVPPNIAQKIIKMFIRIAEEKSDLLNTVLVLSNSYSESMEKEKYTRTKFYLYISKSKAGEQYFDSLNGSAFVSDEGSYRSNSFLIRQKNIVHE